MNKDRHAARAAVLMFPALIGVIGFLIDGQHSFLDSLFRCLTMYALNYTEAPPNALVEIARWTAPLATTGGILLAIFSTKDRIRNRTLSRSPNSIAIYGDAEEQNLLLAQAGRYGIRGGEKFLPAARYILAGTEDDNLAFYAQHKARLCDRPVFLKCRSMQVRPEPGTNVRIYSPEEIAARLFWKEHCLYSEAAKHDFALSIAMIGFGELGEELLYWGLQDNLFDPNQKITYHIFGDCSEFLHIHPGVREISDRIVQHSESWDCSIDVLRSVQRILILSQDDTVQTLQKLLLLPNLPDIVCFSPSELHFDLFETEHRVIWYPWGSIANRIENITEDGLIRLAKRIHLRYLHMNEGMQETEENLEKEWQKLNSFKRYSNIGAADYHEIRLIMLQEMGIPARYDALPAPVLELFAALEHERWCRYHYLNNWTHGVPESGKRSDPVKRIHTDLVPLEALPASELHKDYDNVEIALSL